MSLIDNSEIKGVNTVNPFHLEPLMLVLVDRKKLTLDEARSIASQVKLAKCSSTAFMIQQQKISPLEIALALSHCLQLEYLDLDNLSKEEIPENVIDASLITQYQVLPLLIRKNTLTLGIREPIQLGICKELKFHTDLDIQPVIVEWDKLEKCISSYTNQQQYNVFNQTTIVSDTENDGRIISFVQHIISDAICRSASDIHFEPHKTTCRIRLRIDGILHKVAELPSDLIHRITARLKIMSKLDIAEKRLPQDGRFSLSVDKDITRDCRLSTCPTLFGEKTVVRILDGHCASLNIPDLGMEKEQENIFLSEIKKPQGLILITGPTGSGKTLTLYSALNFLNGLDKNISTVEDPVEIELPGLNQVHVNAKINLTFSSVLRAFLRQDPDILMVGEIRDQETAEIAIKAAQTGHLVFSTLHTNSAYEALSRLQMMGVSAVNLISSARLIIAQRLIRKLCIHCKSMVTMPDKIQLSQNFAKCELSTIKIYQAVGCKECMKGYWGRSGVFELLHMTDEIRSLIIEKIDILKIKQKSLANGQIDLQSAALNKVRNGITSLEEMFRITV